MNVKSIPPIAATLDPHVISVSSLSKSYGLPGIRIGWCITQDADLMYALLAAKEQIVITNSVIDEELAFYAYENRKTLLEKVTNEIITKHKAIFMSWVQANGDMIECVEPSAGVVAFPRLKHLNEEQVKKFYAILQGELKTWVGCGHWFGFSDEYMRIGYGWPATEELKNGLEAIKIAYHRVRVNN